MTRSIATVVESRQSFTGLTPLLVAGAQELRQAHQGGVGEAAHAGPPHCGEVRWWKPGGDVFG